MIPNNQNKIYTSSSSYVSRSSGLFRLFNTMSGGLIATERQANLVAIIFIVIFVAISIFLFTDANKKEEPANYSLPADGPIESLVPLPK